MSDSFKVALAGLGTVGGGVAKLLSEQKDVLLKRCGRPIELIAAADKNAARFDELGLPSSVERFDDARKMAEETPAEAAPTSYFAPPQILTDEFFDKTVYLGDSVIGTLATYCAENN